MDIAKEAEIFTLKYYEDNFSSSLSYHSIEHTQLVVKVASKISKVEGLDKRNKDIVVVAAWFHDIGHATSIKNHEEEGSKIAQQFLTAKGMDAEFISEVKTCICATKPGMPRNSLKEKILYDADLAHTGMENFMEISNLLRKELKNITERKCTKLEYWQKTFEFIKEVRFLTQYAKENMEEIKNQNIKKVEKRIKKLLIENKDIIPRLTIKNTTRGIETMFRLTARNQINLSSIADNKANMMLTINAIIVSVLVSTSAINFQNSQYDIVIPGLILVFGCLISLVFAILSVRPKYNSGKVTDEDLKNRKTNLLFFGNFIKIDYPKYESSVKEMMDDYDYLYGTMIKDQYNLGKVLSQKYKLLTYSYNFFMFSFVIAVLTFFTLYFLKK